MPRPSRPRAGERRVLTVLFCDLVESGRLAERLDPEDWNDIISDYHRACESVVRRFQGHVAKELGDGLIAYFGWPESREDDARGAVRTGLGVIAAMQALNGRLQRDHGIGLRVRIGIDTGAVVVGEEHATGSALNVASRLQSLAQPDTVVISGATFDLVGGYFIYQNLGRHRLRNVESAVQVYRVVAESGATDRLDAAGESRLSPFVGRQTEFATLCSLWERAAAGRSQTALVSGEPGIGKSRLVRKLRRRVEDGAGDAMAGCIEFRCSRYDSQSALVPVISRLERVLRIDESQTPAEKMERLEQTVRELGFSLAEVAPLLASQFSLPLPDRYAVPSLSAEERREKTLDFLVEWLLRSAQRQPLLAVWEDLHWADPSTLELLGLLFKRVAEADAPLLNLVTFRPDEFQPPWRVLPSPAEVALGRFERSEVEGMITELAGGRPLPVEVVDQIVEKADGVPLFVEELLQTVVDAGIVHDDGGHFVVARPIEIPATLEGSLMSRLDRLGPAKAVAQRCAVLGRAFSEDLVRAVLAADETDGGGRTAAWQHAERCLAQLVEAGVLRSRREAQTTYEFKHALIQEVAYQSLLKRTRQAYHLQTAQVLESQFGHVAQQQPELLARHYAEASQLDKALDYWQKAGTRARDRSANREAIHHFGEALKMLEARELSLRVGSLTPLIAVKGYVARETVDAAHSALALGKELGERTRLFPARYVLWVDRLVRADYTAALRLGEEFQREAESQRDTGPLLMAHRQRGFCLFSLGNLAGASDQLKRSLELYDPQWHGELKHQGYGQDPRCACEAFLSLVRWLQGFPDDAAEWSRQAVRNAAKASHSNTWGYTLCFGGAIAGVFQRNVPWAEQRASELVAFAQAEAMSVWLAYGRVLHGWALSRSGRAEEGVELMQKGLADFNHPSREKAAALLGRPPLEMAFMKSFLLSLLAEGYGTLGRPAEGLAHLDAAWSFVEATGEGFWKAEVRRLKGELLLAGDAVSHETRLEAMACFQEAGDIARVQGARSLELRAATSLSRLQSREEPSGARRLLQEAYDAFAEGVDSADLVDARRLLDELQGT